MTDRRYSDGCNSSGSSSSSSNSSSIGNGNSNSNGNGGGKRNGGFGSASWPATRSHKIRRRSNASSQPPLAAAAMHVKKTWKNAAVMLLAVAALTTATAAFYFNYAATACCAVAQSSSSSSSSASSTSSLSAAIAFAAFAAERSDRASIGSSVLRAAKLYAVCETRDYRRRAVDRERLRRSRRQTIADETTPDRNPSGDGGGTTKGTTGGTTNGTTKGTDGETTAENATLIYFVTPTYPRREQVAELTRLGQTLMLVPRVHWIVADDRADCGPQIAKMLPDFSIPYTYIASPMPAIYKRTADAMPRGVSNRRAALNWIRLNHDANDTNAVIYFGDDDNTFHLDLFKEIRTTKKISMFPVGLVGEYGVSSPIVEKGKVVGFFDSWPAKRKFPVDMAGFAINVQLLFKFPYATMPYKAGFEEDRFLSALSIRLDEIEPKAENCTRILVWHTQTAKKPKPTVKVKSKSALPGSLATLLDQVTMLGVGDVSETTGIRSYMTKNGNIFRV